MKKLFYILLFLSAASASITACTEEEIKPQTEGSNAGGRASASITACTEEEIKPQTEGSNAGGSPIKE